VPGFFLPNGAQGSMRHMIDLSSWQGVLSTLLALLLFSLAAVGVRLLFMHVVQRRRERENRQINERLKTLIAAYKVLGGSFTGDLAVDPAHLRDLRAATSTVSAAPDAMVDDVPHDISTTDRRRRIRDAVEAALSDVILLGTEEQVRLAAQAANEMVAGRRVETAALVVSLRRFIREVLDLDAIPAGLAIPDQGPLRMGAGAGANRGARAGERGSGGGRGASGGGGEGGMLGMGMSSDNVER
jgi:hypothetical protein